MRLLSVISFAVLLLVAATNRLSGEAAAEPGQIAAPSEVVPAVKSVAAVVSLENRHDRIVNRIWIGSILTVLVATGLDAETSWGKYEGNSLLSSSNGTFGAKGISVKAGLAASAIITQVLLRKHKDVKRKFVIANFGAAALFTAVAAHNVGIASPK